VGESWFSGFVLSFFQNTLFFLILSGSFFDKLTTSFPLTPPGHLFTHWWRGLVSQFPKAVYSFRLSFISFLFYLLPSTLPHIGCHFLRPAVSNSFFLVVAVPCLITKPRLVILVGFFPCANGSTFTLATVPSFFTPIQTSRLCCLAASH